MRVAQSKLQKIKAAAHCVQTVLIFIAGCLTLGVMTKSEGYGGQTAFYFALCFLTLPAIIYQTMVPLWSRAWRLNNVYAFAAIDIMFAILWFAASIAVAVWNANGIAQGRTISSDDKSGKTKRADVLKDGTCASFGYGSQIKCNVSKASVGFGIIIFLTFAFTSYLAIRNLLLFRTTGALPNASMPGPPGKAEAFQGDDTNDADPWSTNTDDLHNDGRPVFGRRDSSDRQGLLRRDYEEEATRPVSGIPHPGRRLSYHRSAPVNVTPAYDDGFAPSALSPTGLSVNPNERIQFPPADYNALR